jgi:hypothetical protein
MVRGFAARVKPAAWIWGVKSIAKGTLLVGDLGLTNVREKAGVGRSTLGKVLAGLFQAQLAVHREPDFRGVFVFLPIVFPPAHWTKRERVHRLQGLVSATWAAITSHHKPLAWIDEAWESGFTAGAV